MSADARAAIRAILGLPEWRDGMVLLMYWIYNRDGQQANAGPVIALMNRSDLPEHPPVLFDDKDVTIFNGIPPEIVSNLDNAVLEFRDGNFEFAVGQG